MFGNNVLAENMKGDKVKTKIKIGIILVLSLLLIIICWNIYKQSPRYIIKDTVMWYEKDFTIPLFCKKVKFDYDRETDTYTGKFCLNEADKDKLMDKLENAHERSKEQQYIYFQEMGRPIRKLGEVVLNTTIVSDNHAEKQNIDSEKIYPESWMLEDNAELIGYYWTSPRYIDSVTLFQDINDYGKIPYCYIVIYKNTEGKYYLCVKRTYFDDWDGPESL